MNNFSWPDSPGKTAFPVAAAGYPLIFAAAFITIVFALLDFTFLTLVSLGMTIFTCCFFRDPDRLTPKGDGIVVSPADGKVVFAGMADSSPFTDIRCLKISIFMTIFNVHVNRIPHEGTIKETVYYPGKFFSANLDKASKENERNAVLIETEKGKEICVVQIAGLIARRIIRRIQEGDRVVRGQRFGMICFGSRLDVYLPADSKIDVVLGEKVIAGTSVLGRLT
ncbi:phosphatidylserine decarboxylase family protein [Desulfonema magnum]|uniref:Phosphatidylserine decarboxylase proenzyme n=1 Tax=Desulfonema magnum TaxID=45655 RepID=A0A975BFS8_9BACT|nr:phosphatidylserine decarboxylase family protein [Desulfonema magnum]QTA84617.1 Phosphatidylserine decarboxylase proenzyme [Desulfonema magnum]